jgi:hypothetical protein
MSAKIITGYYTATYTVTAANTPLTNEGTIYTQGNGDPVGVYREVVPLFRTRV